MTKTPTIDTLLAAIEAGDHDAYLPLSDALEESGDSTRAMGARWLWREGKRPKFNCFGDDSWDWWATYTFQSKHCERLPLPAWIKIAVGVRRSGVEERGVYPTHADAILDAARAVGECLEKGELT